MENLDIQKLADKCMEISMNAFAKNNQMKISDPNFMRIIAMSIYASALLQVATKDSKTSLFEKLEKGEL